MDYAYNAGILQIYEIPELKYAVNIGVVLCWNSEFISTEYIEILGYYCSECTLLVEGTTTATFVEEYEFNFCTLEEFRRKTSNELSLPFESFIRELGDRRRQTCFCDRYVRPNGTSK